MGNALKSILRKVFSLFTIGLVSNLRQANDLLLLRHWEYLKNNTRNPLNRYGAKYFSQNDEDGITLEIIRRLQIENGVFVEFGVGDGSENNSLILLANGWKGFWVGGEELCFDPEINTDHFCFLKRWVVLENIVGIYRAGLEQIKEKSVDVVSLDLDGNDYYLIEELLASAKSAPQLFIVEYNSQFPPPVRWRIPYNAKHVWACDDYFGASLVEFVDLMKRYGYSLICCNFSGSNAFFVKEESLHLFPEVPEDISAIYCQPLYYNLQSCGHRTSPKSIEIMIKKGMMA